MEPMSEPSNVHTPNKSTCTSKQTHNRFQHVNTCTKIAIASVDQFQNSAYNHRYRPDDLTGGHALSTNLYKGLEKVGVKSYVKRPV